jgi:hypothetical protein
MKHYYVSFLFIISVFCSCNIINPTEKIPAYISIDTFLLNTDFGLQGSNAAKITDAWIYVNDNPIGVFELPCKIPAINEGNCKISIGPGIKTNGISATRTVYPFYKYYDVQVDLIPEMETKISPVTVYFDSISFPFKTNFDDAAGISLEATNKSDTGVFITNTQGEVFEGNGSLKAVLAQDTGYLEFRQVDAVQLPKQGKLVFAELNFNCNRVITVVLYSNYISSAPKIDNVISLSPTDGKWNKIYIDLTKYVSTEVNASNYRLYFTASKLDKKGPLILLMDNLKIVAQQQ